MKRGYTIIDTTITLSLISILSAVTMPRISGMLDAIKVRGAVSDAESLFDAARHLAISHGSQMIVEIDGGRRVISVRAGTDTLKKRDFGEAYGVDLTTNRLTMSYSPIGFGYGAANLSLVIRRNGAVDTVVVSRLGRVRD